MSQSSGPRPRDNRVDRGTAGMPRETKRSHEMKAWTEIEKELDEIHREIDHIKEMIRKAFKGNAA